MKLNSNFAVIAIVIMVFFVFAFVGNFYGTLKAGGDNQFFRLAESFLSGQTYFKDKIEIYDAAFFNGNYYWPLGPFPALLFIPFVLSAKIIPSIKLYSSGVINFTLAVAVFVLIYFIARKKDYLKEDSIFLACAFCFSSMFLGIIMLANAWYMAHALTVFLLFLAIYFYLDGRHPVYIGILFAIILATRFTAVVGLLFFVLMVLFSDKTMRFKIKNISVMVVPVIVGFLLLGIYNFQRFGSFIEQGYNYQIIFWDFLRNARDNYGIISLYHLPGNIFRALMAVPLPIYKDRTAHVFRFPFITADLWGMSIFFTSPYLLMLFFYNYRDKILKSLLFTSIIIAIPLFLYYGVGVVQFGYRYGLDFMPFLFLLFLIGYKDQISPKITWRMKSVIILSAFLNMYILLVVFSGEQYGNFPGDNYINSIAR